MLIAYVVHVTVCVVYMLSCVQCVTLIQQMMCFTTGDIWSLADRWITQCKWFVLYALQVLPNLMAFKIMSEWRICYRLCEGHWTIVTYCVIVQVILLMSTQRGTRLKNGGLSYGI